MIGIIGLGKMGREMARNLVKIQGPNTLAVYDISPDVTNSVAASLGVVPASSASMLARMCSSVISIVPNDAALRTVVCGENGILAGVNAGANVLHVSCSTVSPFTSREVSESGKSKLVHVSAPVFARPDGIAKQQAYFPVSGATSAHRAAAIQVTLQL
jgi:3-hydroxyisobutyrate dehydrogenase-like beta-hydroxyacid dehydrogenase